MRLINVKKARLEEFLSQEKPAYVVLSHRWTENEVSFSDICAADFQSATSSRKFRGMLQQAKHNRAYYAWIDTCCIDKTNNVELSEAINSMYQWYQGAKSCYVYLRDVHKDNWKESFPKSEWFVRGWTLQELLAPRKVVFYDCKWKVLGDRVALADIISDITGIPPEVLKTRDLSNYSVAQKMAWAARRVTTRLEDRAYCLMGLFGVNMSLLYGEGEKAFFRLQEEIIKHNDDHSIFAWSMDRKLKCSGLLAARPDCFEGSRKMVSYLLPGDREPFALTNRGLSIKLKITPWYTDTYIAYLDCAEETHGYERPSWVRVGIFLRRLGEDDQFVRMNWKGRGLWFDGDRSHLWRDRPIQDRRLFVRQTLSPQYRKDCLKARVYGFKFSLPSSLPISAVHRSADGHVATLAPGQWGRVMVIHFPAKCKGVRKIALGFDFEFNPVCLLEDSFSEETSDFCYDWYSVLADDMKWDEISEGRCYRKEIHDGRWALKGRRLDGLDVQLLERVGAMGSIVTVKRDETKPRMLWEFRIDNLEDPFRKHNHVNDQEVYGHGISDEGLEQPCDLLEELVPTMGCLEPYGISE